PSCLSRPADQSAGQDFFSPPRRAGRNGYVLGMFEHKNEVFDIPARMRYNRAIKPLHQRMEAETMAVKQTAGRDQLGAFAPKFAQLNDDVLFGEVWSRADKLS